MKMTSYATKTVLAAMAALFIASCGFSLGDGEKFTVFSDDDAYNPAGNAH